MANNAVSACRHLFCTDEMYQLKQAIARECADMENDRVLQQSLTRGGSSASQQHRQLSTESYTPRYAGNKVGRSAGRGAYAAGG